MAIADIQMAWQRCFEDLGNDPWVAIATYRTQIVLLWPTALLQEWIAIFAMRG